MTAPPPTARAWTYIGLAIALLGIPLVVTLFKLADFTRADSAAMVARELLILALVGFLLWIVRSREARPLSSIGLKPQPVVPAILWSFVTLLAFAAALAVSLSILPLLGLTFGQSQGPVAALGVTFLTVLRAGIAEEIFYRGYAIERLEELTGSRALAAGIPLITFAGFHYSQGVAGVLIALALGAVATAIYLWKRNLVILIAAHFAIDFIPNVPLPLLGGGR